MIQLRPYQEQLIDGIRAQIRAGCRSILAVSPTGSGKTVMFSYITSRSKERVYIVVHRSEILDQISRTLSQFSVQHGRIQSGFPFAPMHRIQIASVDTLAQRHAHCIPPGIIIIDEAHHAVTQSYRTVFNAWPQALRLGVTATPERLDGAPLSDVFDSMALGPTVEWLISEGMLARPIYYGPEHDVKRGTIVGHPEHHLERICPGARAVVFCTSIRHARTMAQRFTDAGIAAESIDGQQSIDQRAAIIRRLERKEIRAVTSCELISEGFDLPAVDAAVLLRKTDSLALHLQQIGRVLRPSPGKTNAYILDHVGNVAKHGTAEQQRDWAIDGLPASQRGAASKMRRCKNCFAMFDGMECPQCGAESEHKQRVVKEIEGQLKRMEATNERKQAHTLEELIQIGKQRGYKPGWAYHVHRSRGAKTNYRGGEPASRHALVPESGGML